VVEEFAEEFPRPKTQDLAAALKRWGVESEQKALLILPELPDNIYLSARNLERLKVITATNLNVYDLLHADTIITTAAGLAKIHEVYND